jgi:hypothetical protein
LVALSRGSIHGWQPLKYSFHNELEKCPVENARIIAVCPSAGTGQDEDAMLTVKNQEEPRLIGYEYTVYPGVMKHNKKVLTLPRVLHIMRYIQIVR